MGKCISIQTHFPIYLLILTIWDLKSPSHVSSYCIPEVLEQGLQWHHAFSHRKVSQILLQRKSSCIRRFWDLFPGIISSALPSEVAEPRKAGNLLRQIFRSSVCRGNRPRRGETGTKYSFMSDLSPRSLCKQPDPLVPATCSTPMPGWMGTAPAPAISWHGNISTSRAWVGLKRGVTPWHLFAHSAQLLMLGHLDGPNLLSPTQAEGLWCLTW